MKKPTVSVCIITFNAESTIKDTLDSICRQTFKKNEIEIIIADDHSTDKTASIISHWISKNKELFFNVELIIQEKNLGISRNVNTAWRKATAEWVKTIAGDDMLAPRCIESNLKYLLNKKNIHVLFSYMTTFSEKNSEFTFNKNLPEERNINFFNLTAHEQFVFLLCNSFNFAPSSFISKKALEKVEFAEEQFSLIEDLPLWLKLTKEDFKLYFNPEVTVYYRISDSLSNSTTRFTNINFNKEIIKLHGKSIKPHIKGIKQHIYYYDKIIELKSNNLIASMMGNKKNIISYMMQKSISLIRPRWYITHLKRIKHKCIG